MLSRQTLGRLLVSAFQSMRQTNYYLPHCVDILSDLALRSGTIAVFTAIPLIASIITDFAAKRRRRADVESLSLRANSTAQRQPSIASTGSGFQGRVDTVMSWIERSVEHLPNIPRLHPQECVKRSICEAHNEPQKYGAIGFMLRLLFP